MWELLRSFWPISGARSRSPTGWPAPVASTFARSFKEAQSYLSFLMMAQMVPGMMATMNTMSTKAWMYYVPWIGQQSLLTDVLGNKAINPIVFVVVALINVTLAVVVLRGTSGLLHREKIIFGR